jgi:O-antigen/teichoic acid export membrane protein
MERAIERRHRSRLPLKLILAVLFAAIAIWLYDMYTSPTPIQWADMRSFVLGYFFGSFTMEWIRQRSNRMNSADR